MTQEIATIIDRQPVLPLPGLVSSEARAVEHNLQGHLKKVYKSQFPYDDQFDFDIMAKLPWIHSVFSKDNFDDFFLACTPYNLINEGVQHEASAVPFQLLQIVGNYWYTARALKCLVKFICHPTHEYRLQLQWLPSVYFKTLAAAQVRYPEFGTLNFKGQRWEMNIKQQQNYEFDLTSTMPYLRRRTTQKTVPWALTEGSVFSYRGNSSRNSDLSPCFGLLAVVPMNTFQYSTIAPDTFQVVVSFVYDGLETSEPRGILGSLIMSDV